MYVYCACVDSVCVDETSDVMVETVCSTAHLCNMHVHCTKAYAINDSNTRRVDIHGLWTCTHSDIDTNLGMLSLIPRILINFLVAWE